MKRTKLNVPGPIARALLTRDERVASPSYPRDYPFVASHGRGTELFDVDGNRYLDFCAGIAVAATGHSHPEVVEAIREQAGKFLHVSSDFWHEGFTSLLEQLDRLAPFGEAAKTFACNSGTEAVETAIKLAKYATGRPRFIGFHGGFHGRTLGSLAFTASKAATQRRHFFPMMAGVTHVPFPDPYRPRVDLRSGEDLGQATIRYIEETIFRYECPPEEVAAFLVEPIQGEGGYVVPPASFLPALRQLCSQYGILLIVDEVQSGIGRTGKFWAIEHSGVEPDIVASAKGIASGLPLGACIARSSVMNWPAGAHGNTYGGNPLACAAALATLRLVENGMMQNAVAMGARLTEGLRTLAARHPSIGDLRGPGLMIGVELVLDRQRRSFAAELRDRLVTSAFEHGLLLLGCGKNVVRITPPLSVTAAECDEALEIFDLALDEAEREAGLV